jgi:hypothetical protein
LLFLCDKHSVLHKYITKERKIDDRILKPTVCYRLQIKQCPNLYIKKENKNWIDKDKTFWGITVDKNHIIYIRRNGKCMWTGNTGKTNWYTARMHDPNKKGVMIDNAQKEFSVYANETKIKIYNVSLQSTIPTFEKISYDEYFKKVTPLTISQAEIRKELELKFKELNHMYMRLHNSPVSFDSRGLFYNK